MKEARWDLEVGLEMFFTGAHDLASGGAGVSEALEATYAGLGAGAGVGTITCADIGDLYDDPDTVLSAGTCYDSGGRKDDEELALGLGLGLGLLAAALLVVAVVFGVRERRTRLMYEDIVSANKMGHPADMDIKHPPV